MIDRDMFFFENIQVSRFCPIKYLFFIIQMFVACVEGILINLI